MKLVRFNEGRLGALLADGSVVDLNRAYADYLSSRGEPRPDVKAEALLPSDLRAFIMEGSHGLERAATAIEYVSEGREEDSEGRKLLLRKEDYRLRAPLPSPASKIAMAGANFYDHSVDAARMLRGEELTVEELRARVERGEYRPWGFWKQSCFVVDPEGETPYPAKTRRLDYEVELAAVIGRRGKDIPESQASEYIYGYTIVNDLSIRDLGFGGGPDGLFLAKNFDGSAPMGPCLVTRDEIPNPYQLAMKQWVNEELRQDGNMSSIIRGFEWWIAWLSRDITLYPGDMVCGGTCSGTAMDQTPRVNGETDPRLFLKPGDRLTAWIEGIGTLRTWIAPKPQ